MTLNGAIMQLVEMRENSMMPEVFKPYFDKVIETVLECEEPHAQPEIIRCKGCLKYDAHGHRCKHWNHAVVVMDWCSRAERRTDDDRNG